MNPGPAFVETSVDDGFGALLGRHGPTAAQASLAQHTFGVSQGMQQGVSQVRLLSPEERSVTSVLSKAHFDAFARASFCVPRPCAPASAPKQAGKLRLLRFTGRGVYVDRACRTHAAQQLLHSERAVVVPLLCEG